MAAEMISTSARIIIRDSDDPNDGLGLMTLMKGNTFFKKGRVYEVTEVLGELVIRDIGPSALGRTVTDGAIRSVCWQSDAGNILSVGSLIFLTREEFQQEIDRRQSE